MILAVALFILLTSLRGIAGFYTDFLWFDSLDYDSVFTGILGARVALGAIFTGIFFVLLYVNLFIADRLAPPLRPTGPEEEVIERYRELIGGRTTLVRVVVSLLFALIAGAGVASQWNSWILFTNAQEFGVADPQFGEDIGFYVFRLPFLTFVVDWAFASVIIIAIVTAVAHYLNGGIRVQAPSQRVGRQVKGHLSVLLGLLALIRAVGYYLARYELNFSGRGAVEGATYTDVNAQLPALNLLILISLAAFVLFIVNIRRQGWVLPALGVGLWAIVAVVVGGIVPAFVQTFRVQPQQLARERPFIERNITATRAAFGLQDVKTDAFGNAGDINGDTLADNADIVRNIRLWDPDLLLETYRQIQGVRDFYEIVDVDVDRYEIGGQKTQVMISARELDSSGVPQTSWEARTLAYTHGYGVVLSPANAKQANGRPSLLLADIPVREVADIPLQEPAIYVGEGLDGYVITGTDRREIDYQDVAGETQFRAYEGEAGVGIGSYLRRAAFALRFGDINPLISGNLRTDSRILFQRDVEERVSALAPFLRADADPYPVVIEGRIVYVVDLYTTSSNYPYSQTAISGDLPGASGLRGDFNYVRNSVKAVVDAYDGTVTFYVVDEDDPVVAAYREAFPDLFTDGDEVSEELRAHFRYPEDLFRVQTNMWGAYHVSNPDDFLNRNDAWDVAQAPGNEFAPASQTLDPVTGLPTGPGRAQRFEPYYQLLRLPGEEEQQFVMLRPFVPASEDDSGRLLTAFMTASSDPGSYGQLRSFVLPRSELPEGPVLIGGTIASNPQVAALQTLLGQEGSDLEYGNLLLVPMEESILYVRPLYVSATSNPVPELERVIVVYEGEVAVEPTLRESLEALFGSAPETLESDVAEGDDTEPADPPQEDGGEPSPAEPVEPGADVPSLLAAAADAFDDAQAALGDGDLGLYQEKVAEAQELVERAQEVVSTTTSTTPEDATA
ncbi:MAG: UPF0182 family protein [Actinomycetota bacterium]|nr:UPF0182 family protein [Actinomycetota bacterium]